MWYQQMFHVWNKIKQTNSITFPKQIHNHDPSNAFTVTPKLCHIYLSLTPSWIIFPRSRERKKKILMKKIFSSLSVYAFTSKVSEFFCYFSTTFDVNILMGSKGYWIMKVSRNWWASWAMYEHKTVNEHV